MMKYLSSITSYFKERLNTWEKRCLVLGGTAGLTVAIIALTLGVAASPFTGGGSLVAALGVILFYTAAGAGSLKYIGKGIDSIVDLNQTGNTNNARLAALSGATVGLGLGVASLFCPAIGAIGTLINLFQIDKLAIWLASSLLTLGWTGFAAAGAERMGAIVDAHTAGQSVAIKFFKWVKSKTGLNAHDATQVAAIQKAPNAVGRSQSDMLHGLGARPSSHAISQPKTDSNNMVSQSNWKSWMPSLSRRNSNETPYNDNVRQLLANANSTPMKKSHTFGGC